MLLTAAFITCIFSGLDLYILNEKKVSNISKIGYAGPITMWRFRTRFPIYPVINLGNSLPSMTLAEPFDLEI